MPSGATEKARLESILAAAAANDNEHDGFDAAKSQDLRQAARDRVRKDTGGRERAHKRHRTTAESKDRRLKRFARELVIQSLSKYKEQIDRDTFKKYAEQVGQL
jgi:histone-lysine N-methyltransferase SETD2